MSTSPLRMALVLAVAGALPGLSSTARAQDSDATVVQNGDLNFAVATQFAGSTASVSQTSTDLTGDAAEGNDVVVVQYGGTATITQTGERNEALLLQAGSSATLSQNGLENGIILGQVDASVADVVQDGARNRAIFGEVTDASAELLQDGDDNGFYALQFNSITKVDQLGDGNVVTVFMSNEGVADVIQEGDGNVLQGLGSDPVAAIHNGSELTLAQYGNDSVAYVDMFNGSDANVEQHGNDSVSTVTHH